MEEHGNIIIYKDKNGNDNIEVKMQDNTVWLNQEQLVKLYNSSKSNISEHIKHIFEDKELEESSTVRNFRTVASNGKTYNMMYYNLDMIVAVGFRVRSNIGTNFRRWANERLTEYMTKGFTMNDDLLKRAGGGLYFDELLSRIRDIRSSEKVFYRKILDIYATSIDYDPKAEITQEFFKTVQNKMHFAIHGNTAAEIIVERADGNKDFMGLTSFSGDKPTLLDAQIAKNYLNDKELDILNRLVSMYLDYAELQALEQKTMTMSDWVKELNYFLTMNRKDILKDSGKISHEEAMNHARKEYNKYKDKIALKPSEVELHYLESIKDLEKLENKN
jgi:hypothetical protein